MFKLGTEEISEETSKELREFVEKNIFVKKYLFFENKGKKQVAYCKCGEYETKGLKHNEEVKCEKCGEKFKAKNIKLGRKNIYENACLSWYEKKDDNTIICKGYFLEKDFKDYKNIKIKYDLLAIYIFKYGKGAKLYTYNYYYNEFIERASVFNFAQGWLQNTRYFVDNDNFIEVINKTNFKYMPILNYANKYTVRDLEKFAKYPWLEQLYKMGFKYLTLEMLNGNNSYRIINYKGKNIFKKLKLTKGKVKELMKNNPEQINSKTLRLFQLLNMNGDNTTIDEVREINKKLTYGSVDILSFLSKQIKVKRVLNYLENKINKDNKKENFTFSNELIEYKDYLKAAIKLNYNLKDRKILLPNDLKKAHDKAFMAVKVKENAEIDNKILRNLEKLEKYKFEYNGLLIRPAESTADLVKEGTSLRHCVATNYTNLYANGQTIILFIRRKNDPYKSFYTVEVRKDRVIQVRGYRNKDATEEIKKFMNQFEKKILNENKNKKLKIA